MWVSLKHDECSGHLSEPSGRGVLYRHWSLVALCRRRSVLGQEPPASRHPASTAYTAGRLSPVALAMAATFSPVARRVRMIRSCSGFTLTRRPFLELPQRLPLS